MQWGSWDSYQDIRESRASSRVARGGTWESSQEPAVESSLISSCSGELGVPLEIWQETQGFSQVQTGESGFLSNCITNSGFISRGNRDLGFPLELQKGSQASILVEVGNSDFLSRCNSRGGPPLQLQRGISGFLLIFSKGVGQPLNFQGAIWCSS